MYGHICNEGTGVAGANQVSQRITSRMTADKSVANLGEEKEI